MAKPTSNCQKVGCFPIGSINLLCRLADNSVLNNIAFAYNVPSITTVCGGPFGIEDIVRAGGPKFALLGFMLLLVWAIPEALITAELSTAFPGSSGSVGTYALCYLFYILMMFTKHPMNII